MSFILDPSLYDHAPFALTALDLTAVSLDLFLYCSSLNLPTKSRGAASARVGWPCDYYNLGNFMRTLAMPRTAEPWSLTSLREKLIKIGAKITSHGRYVTFQMAEVAVSRQMFADILSLIARLRAPPAPA
jgi:hypothetical protein